jgi:hypothetical protein
MAIQVELDGTPIAADGQVTVRVKMRGLKAPVSESELGPLCQALVIQAPWGDKEVTFFVSVPKGLGEGEATRALSVFHKHYTRRHSHLSRMLAFVSEHLCYHDE